MFGFLSVIIPKWSWFYKIDLGECLDCGAVHEKTLSGLCSNCFTELVYVREYEIMSSLQEKISDKAKRCLSLCAIIGYENLVNLYRAEDDMDIRRYFRCVSSSISRDPYQERSSLKQIKYSQSGYETWLKSLDSLYLKIFKVHMVTFREKNARGDSIWETLWDITRSCSLPEDDHMFIVKYFNDNMLL